MDISVEFALPGSDSRFVAAMYSMLEGDHPETGLTDMVMPQTFMMRFLLTGGWTHSTWRGDWAPTPPAALWGSASRMVKLRYSKPFRIFTIGLRTASWLELSGVPLLGLVDRVTPLELYFGRQVSELHRALQQAGDIGQMAALADSWLAGLRRSAVRPALIERARHFEEFAMFHWQRSIGEIADEFQLSTRQLERISLQCLGHKPKLLTRRQRFLDVAAAMRGVGDLEWQELCYRYYSDQSHMSREFRKFSGMAPGEFREAHAPLLDITLRSRATIAETIGQPGGRSDPSFGLPVRQRAV